MIIIIFFKHEIKMGTFVIQEKKGQVLEHHFGGSMCTCLVRFSKGSGASQFLQYFRVNPLIMP